MKYFLTAALLVASPALAQQITLDISFSEKAAQTLADKGELVMVSAYFMGEPAKGASLQPDEMGMIYLGGEDLTLWPRAQTVTIGALLAGAPVDQVTAPRVNVNLYSARISSEDNLLDCTLVDDEVAALTAAPQSVLCKLIGE